jgi:hypothetical protein
MNTTPEISSSSQSAAKLIFQADGTSTEYVLNGSTVTIGRTEDNDIVLDDPSVSSQHAEIAPLEGGWVLKDLGSSNGTTRNGAPIAESRLRDGDLIGFAEVRCRFEEQRLLSTAIVKAQLRRLYDTFRSEPEKMFFSAILFVGVLVFSLDWSSNNEKSTKPALQDASGHEGTSSKSGPRKPIDLEASLAGPLLLEGGLPTALSLHDFETVMDRPFSSSEYRVPCRKRFSISYTAPDKVKLRVLAEQYRTVFDSFYASGSKSSWEPITGQFADVELNPNELKSFVPLHRKYVDWVQISKAERLPPTHEKEIGAFQHLKVQFVTPNVMKLCNYSGQYCVPLEPEDVDMLCEVIASAPVLKQRIHRRIQELKNKETATAKERERKIAADDAERERVKSLLK